MCNGVPLSQNTGNVELPVILNLRPGPIVLCQFTGCNLTLIYLKSLRCGNPIRGWSFITVRGTTSLRGSIILRLSGSLSHFLVLVGGYIHIYLVVYGPEIIGSLGLEEKSQNIKNKTKAVCGLGRTNYGGLRNVRPPVIDPY